MPNEKASSSAVPPPIKNPWVSWSGGSTTFEQEKPPQLSPTDRDQTVIVAWQGHNLRQYKLPGFVADAFIAGKGYEGLDLMKNTAAYAGPLAVKKYSTLHKGWRVAPVEGVEQGTPEHDLSERFAREITHHLFRILDEETDSIQDFRHVLYELADYVHAGNALVEMTWEYRDPKFCLPGTKKGQWGWKRFTHRPPQQIGFDFDFYHMGVRSVTARNQTGQLQFDIPVERCVIATFRPQHSLVFGMGVGRTCYKHWYLLDVLEKVHGVALERFGSPFLIGRAPAGDEELMNRIRDALDAIRAGASAVLPDNMLVELHQIDAQSLSGFERNKEWHKRMIAYEVLSNELTMQQGTGQGSYALGEVHQTTQEYGMGFVRRDLESIIKHQVFRRWVRYNYGAEYEWLTPNLHLGDWDNADRKLVAEWVDKLSEHGVIWKREPFIRALAHLPPMDPQSQKEQAEEEAFQRTVQTTKLINQTEGQD